MRLTFFHTGRNYFPVSISLPDDRFISAYNGLMVIAEKGLPKDKVLKTEDTVIWTHAPSANADDRINIMLDCGKDRF